MTTLIEAKLQLITACNDYISHNKQQLDALVAKPCPLVKSEGTPKPGLVNWLAFHFDQLGIFISRIERQNGGGTNANIILNVVHDEKIDDPQNVLKRLEAALHALTPYAPTNSKWALQEKNYTYDESAPISTKLHLSFKHLSALIVQLAAKDNLDALSFRVLRDHLQQNLSNDFQGYVKSIAVRELLQVLNTPAITDKQRLENFKMQLNAGKTKEILYTNRQSQTEHYLKVLSVISIFIGIGIITTLGLSAKRLYDTGGRSANFFQPLTRDLADNMKTIIDNIDDSPAANL